MPGRLFRCQTVYPHDSRPKWLGGAPRRAEEGDQGSTWGSAIVRPCLEQRGPRAPPLILETVWQRNFLIRPVGETSLQMLIIMLERARFLAVLSGEKKKTREAEELFTELHAGKRQDRSFLCIKKKTMPNNKSKGLFVISSCRALYTFFDVLYPRHKWTILHCQRTLEPLRRAIGGTTFIILTKGNKQLPQHLTAFSHLQILE